MHEPPITHIKSKHPITYIMQQIETIFNLKYKNQPNIQ